MLEHRSLAHSYRRHAALEAQNSPLNAHLAHTLSESAEALRAIGAAPARKRQPALVLAALHDLALAGRAPALAAAFTTTDAEAATHAAIDTLLQQTDEVVAIVTKRRLRADEAGHHAVLYPAIAELASRISASSVGLIDVGRAAGLNLNVDHAGITYSDGGSLGRTDSPVQRTAKVVGRRRVPSSKIPKVVAKVVVDTDPLDVTDPSDARWLRACLPPDRPDEAAALAAELALAASDPPQPLRGDALEKLPEALAPLPANALAVVITTWSLSRYSNERRQGFVERLGEAAADRPIAWVSVEGVGVAPTIPTLGDRPASGHSIIGLAMFDGSARRAEALGRCWLRGRMLEWLV